MSGFWNNSVQYLRKALASDFCINYNHILPVFTTMKYLHVLGKNTNCFAVLRLAWAYMLTSKVTIIRRWSDVLFQDLCIFSYEKLKCNPSSSLSVLIVLSLCFDLCTMRGRLKGHIEWRRARLYFPHRRWLEVSPVVQQSLHVGWGESSRSHSRTMRFTRCFSKALTITPGEAAVLLLIAFAFLARITQAGPRYSSRIVETKTGAIRGIILELNSRHLETVEAFRGVPYAAPPVGDLRYRPPAQPVVWSGTRLADTFGAVCPQRYPDISNRSAAMLIMPRGRYHHLKRLIPLLASQSEDCLFLNLYVPGSGK